ncbi:MULTISPECIES: transporter substrate-binding domain-containing protein [Halomonas]|uniref:transporter substrate-binding domain-containing protein n=1 Tax=Halomonas TaxID=2745 RepID=UPI0028A1633E|nr:MULTISPECIES: transporter substrate-binding domain-containing protein [Halomonas]
MAYFSFRRLLRVSHAVAFFVLLPWGMFCTSAGAQTLAPEKTLTVGVATVPPFVMEAAEGELEGISVDLWQNIAERRGWDFVWQPLPFSDLLDAVEAGDVDVAVGALTMTADREELFDFSHPFYQTGLSIGVPPQADQSLLRVFRALVSWQFLSVVLGLSVLLLAVGLLVWLAEHKRNPEQFGGSVFRGMGAGLWWAAVTMTTVGYGDKAPTTLVGRLIGLVWMFAGLIVVASFTAAITTSLTVGNLTARIQSENDLHGTVVATIDDTASQRYLEEQHVRYRTYPDLTSAMRSVASGETGAVVYDRALMQYRNQQLGADRLTILPGVFAKQLYAFAIPEGSALRAPLSLEVLDVTESERWDDIVSRYLVR